jgi:hypothetical protein
MRKLTLLAAAASFAFAAPAFAQTAPAPAPAAAPQAAPAPAAEDAESPDEAAFEAKADAFGDRMKGMMEEMQAAVAAAGADAAKKKTDLDAIQARYQPEADGFATDLQNFLQTQAAAVPEDQRAGMLEGVEQALPKIRGLPAMLRAQAEQPQAPAPAAAPAQ